MKKIIINENGYRVEWKKGTTWNDKTIGWYMECKVCNILVKVGSDKLLSTTCSTCVSTGLKEFNEDAGS